MISDEARAEIRAHREYWADKPIKWTVDIMREQEAAVEAWLTERDIPLGLHEDSLLEDPEHPFFRIGTRYRFAEEHRDIAMLLKLTFG